MTTTTTATLTSPALQEPSYFQNGDRQAPTQQSITAATTTNNNTSNIAGTSKNISIVQARPKLGTVKERIQMFGGNEAPKPEPTLIQKRREQLSTKWEKDAAKKVATQGSCGRTGKTITDPRKVEWYTSPNSGMYKKRIAIQSSD